MLCDLNFLSSFKIREIQEDKNKHKVKKQTYSFAIKLSPEQLSKYFSFPFCFNTAEEYTHGSMVKQCAYEWQNMETRKYV